MSQPLISMQTNQISPVIHTQNNYHDRQKKTVNFVQVANDSEQDYRARLAEALKKGPLHALEKFSAHTIMHGGNVVLKNILPPDPLEQFAEKKVIQDAKSQAFQLSVELLKAGRVSSQMLPNQEAQKIKTVLDEIENSLLSPEYFSHQGQKFFLAKYMQLNQLQLDYIAPINYITEMWGEAKNGEKQKYRDLLQNKIQEFSICLHNVIVQEPIDQGTDWSDYKGTIGFGTGIATGGAITLAILFKLGLLVLPGGS